MLAGSMCKNMQSLPVVIDTHTHTHPHVHITDQSQNKISLFLNSDSLSSEEADPKTERKENKRY